MTFIPPTPGLPRWVDFSMGMGWFMGMYLSLVAVSVSPLLRILSDKRLAEEVAIAHGLQLPVVVIGVGIWAALKLFGKL